MKYPFNQVIRVLFILFLSISVLQGQRAPIDNQLIYSKNAKKIRTKYEHSAYKLKPSKAGHMGLRLWRNYKNEKYKYLLLQGINHTAGALDKLVENGLDDASLTTYAEAKNLKYKASTKKKKLRKKTFAKYPRYRLMATKILRHVARLEELGLRHEKHDEFMRLIESYDYEKAFVDPTMIKAWGAQLANQVYWLNDLGIADHRDQFMKAVTATYPNIDDENLGKQQFENKIYTLTHIIIVASGYYSKNVDYMTHKHVIDYFRSNVSDIIKRCKEDVVIEVGLSLLLVDESYPEIETIRTYINSRIDPSKKMILSENGKSKMSQGEHRNIIAVLLLDWQGCSPIPAEKDISGMESLFAKSLVFN